MEEFVAGNSLLYCIRLLDSDPENQLYQKIVDKELDDMVSHLKWGKREIEYFRLATNVISESFDELPEIAKNGNPEAHDISITIKAIRLLLERLDKKNSEG